MTGKTKVLTPDIVLKKYWDDKEHFADFFNAALFNGRQVIRPQELEDDDSVNSVILKNGKQVRGIRTARDNIKLCRNVSSQQSVRLVLLGQESQSHIHYAMPFRVMGYDYGTYKRQYDRNAQRYRTERKNPGSAEKLQDNRTLSNVSTEDRDESCQK